MTSDLFEWANRVIWDTYRCESTLTWMEMDTPGGKIGQWCHFIGKRPKVKRPGRPRKDADYDRGFVAQLFDEGMRLVIFEQYNVYMPFPGSSLHRKLQEDAQCQSEESTTPTPADQAPSTAPTQESTSA